MNEDFSRDPAVVAAPNADPLIANESQPGETMAELARADELHGKSFPLITLPLLILHGTADKVTKPSGSKEFYERAGSGDKTLKLYEGHFHDLLAEVGKRQVMADIQALDRCAPGHRCAQPARATECGCIAVVKSRLRWSKLKGARVPCNRVT